MARAYMILCRNDLDDSLLQVLDLSPNTSQANPILSGQDSGQTGYVTFYYTDDVNGDVTTQAGAGGGASLDIDGDTYGLAAYLINCVEDTGGNESLTAAEANSIADAIRDEAASGNDLTLTDINTLINAPAGVAGSDLDGTLGNSFGSVEEVLRILAGERYKMADNNQVRTAAGLFDTTDRGFFVSAAEVEVQASVRNSNDYGVRGRASTAPLPYIRPGEVRGGQAPTNTGTQDDEYQDVRQIVESGDLHLSILSGALSELCDTAYTFENPDFTYGAAGDAATLDGSTITDGEARAIAVYDADGNNIG